MIRPIFRCRYWMHCRCSRRFGTILLVIAATLILNLLLTNTNKPECNDCSPANAEIERARDTLEPRDNQVTESFHSQSGQQELTDDEEGCVLDYLATHEDYCRRFLIPKVSNIRYSEFLLPGLHRVNRSTLCPCLPATLGELLQDHLLCRKYCMYTFLLFDLFSLPISSFGPGLGASVLPIAPRIKIRPWLIRFDLNRVKLVRRVSIIGLVWHGTVGSINPDPDAPFIGRMVERFRDVEAGGRWSPSWCAARHRIAVIVPYSDRETQLRTFLLHFHTMLQRQLIDYNIFVIEQVGKTWLSSSLNWDSKPDLLKAC